MYSDLSDLRSRVVPRLLRKQIFYSEGWHMSINFQLFLRFTSDNNPRTYCWALARLSLWLSNAPKGAKNASNNFDQLRAISKFTIHPYLCISEKSDKLLANWHCRNTIRTRQVV